MNANTYSHPVLLGSIEVLTWRWQRQNNVLLETVSVSLERFSLGEVSDVAL